MTSAITVVQRNDSDQYFGIGWHYSKLQPAKIKQRLSCDCVYGNSVFIFISSDTLTSSLLSTSNQREMPGRLWTRVRVVLSTQRLCINTRYTPKYELIAKHT